MKHFLIVEAPPATGMQTCVSRVCIACGQGLAAGGGPGDYLCLTCLEVLRRGPWKGNLRKLRDATKDERIALSSLI